MEAAPAILLVDDGELDHAQALVQSLGLDWERCCLEATPGAPLMRPRELLLTSGPRAMQLPALSGDAEPIWICLYEPGFLPLRDRLAELGVHYLVSAELEPRALALFLQQLLHRGAERRAQRRIPLHLPLEVEVGFERRKALLVELSLESCVIQTQGEVPAERRVVVRLPSEYTGEQPLCLHGRVVRAASQKRFGGGDGVTTAVRFGEQDTEALGRIHDLLVGHTAGTPVTSLAPEPGSLAGEGWSPGELVHGSPYELGPQPDERRDAARHDFRDRVQVLGGPQPSRRRVALGRDLSRSGVLLSLSPTPRAGETLTLAIHAGASREEPLLVEARVTRSEGGEAALAFEPLLPDQLRRLDRFLEDRSRLESLGAPGVALHVAEILPD